MKFLIMVISIIFLIVACGAVSAADEPIQNNNTQVNTVINNTDYNYELSSLQNSNDIVSSDNMAGIFSNDTWIDPKMDCNKDGNYHIVFEGKKIYNSGDSYFVKIVDKKNNSVENIDVEFYVNNKYIGNYTTNNEGLAGFNLDNNIHNEGNFNIYGKILNNNDYTGSCEHITVINNLNYYNNALSSGSRLKKWNDKHFILCDDGYHAYEPGNEPNWDGKENEPNLNHSIYQIIDWNGNSYHVINATVSQKGMEVFLNLIKTQVYDIAILNLLSHTTYDLSRLKVWNDREFSYSTYHNFGQLIINGNGAKIKSNNENNFMYIGYNSNVIIKNTTITNFNHCFVNNGNLICIDSTFKDNIASKFSFPDFLGGVVNNYNTVSFKNCTFKDNSAKYGVYTAAGGVLDAQPNSKNTFIDCKFCSEKDNLLGRDNSLTVIFSNTYPPENMIKKSYFYEKASFSVVNSSIINNNDIETTTTYWCNDSSQFKQVLKSINTYSNSSQININLKADQTYDITVEDIQNGFRKYNWRENAINYPTAPFIHWTNKAGKGLHYIIDRYVLDVGFTPVIINGNGAKINMKDNKEKYDHHFAFIGSGASLILQNVTLENFNTAIYNVGGSFTAINCTFRNNVIKHENAMGGVLRSFGGDCKFIDCHFGYNYADEETFIYYCKNTNLEFNNCDFLELCESILGPHNNLIPMEKMLGVLMLGKEALNIFEKEYNCKITEETAALVFLTLATKIGLAENSCIISDDEFFIKSATTFKNSEYYTSKTLNNNTHYNINNISCYDKMINDFNNYGNNPSHVMKITLNPNNPIDKFNIADLHIQGTIIIDGNNSIYSSNKNIKNKFNTIIISNFIFKQKNFKLCSNEG
ncbi:hypothetical protein, partial [Methanobrevibacter sp.]|uniref:hypothetical protein n=1 Tax=Methanobrevibacter sp. TaxID=66852 RepID=UPI00388E3CBD